MKKNKALRSIAIAAVLSSAAALIPATPAFAQPEIILDPVSGSIGTEVTLTGTDFASFKNTEVIILFDNQNIDASPLTVPESGSFTTTFTVPDDAEAGTAYVKVQTILGGEIKKSFIVEGPEVGLDSGEGAVGTVVTVEGRGFYAGGETDIYYYTKGNKVNIATETASASGDFSLTLSIPESIAGEHKIIAEDILGNSAEASFEVLPSIILSAYSGATDNQITVGGNGFADGSDITINFGGIEVGEDITNKYGSFQVPVVVPTMESGSYVVEVEDDDGNWSKAAFTIAAGATLNQSSGEVDTPLIVSGVGFNAAVLITITYDNLEVATTVSDENGAFSAAFKAPPSSGGNHTITITDGSNTAEGFGTETQFRGLAVQAQSSEDLFAIGASAGGGFYAGLAGGVTVEILDSDTAAWIGAHADVNQEVAGRNPSQAVNVSAANDVSVFALGGGIGIEHGVGRPLTLNQARLYPLFPWVVLREALVVEDDDFFPPIQ